MKTTPLGLLIIVALPALASASTLAVEVTINSEPSGAAIYADATGELSGYAPVTLLYDVDAETFSAAGCVEVQPITAKWPRYVNHAGGIELIADAAEKTITRRLICSGPHQEIMLQHPTPLRPALDGTAWIALSDTDERFIEERRQQAQGQVDASVQRLTQFVAEQEAQRKADEAAAAARATFNSLAEFYRRRSELLRRSRVANPYRPPVHCTSSAPDFYGVVQTTCQ